LIRVSYVGRQRRSSYEKSVCDPRRYRIGGAPRSPGWRVGGCCAIWRPAGEQPRSLGTARPCGRHDPGLPAADMGRRRGPGHAAARGRARADRRRRRGRRDADARIPPDTVSRTACRAASCPYRGDDRCPTRHRFAGAGSLRTRKNWWGDRTGPYHETSNPDGQGNAVSDRVLFDPWLVTPPRDRKPVPLTLGQMTEDKIWLDRYNDYQILTTGDESLLAQVTPLAGSNALWVYGEAGDIPAYTRFDLRSQILTLRGAYEVLISPAADHGRECRLEAAGAGNLHWINDPDLRDQRRGSDECTAAGRDRATQPGVSAAEYWWRGAVYAG
jgi:hypothetical protein